MMMVSIAFSVPLCHTWEHLLDVLFFFLDFVCVLGTSVKHLERRQIADRHYQLNAKRMEERYCKQKKVHTFEVGDTVALRIPRIDRAATDLHRLPCIVVQQLGKKDLPYQLQCEFGAQNAL